jgi:hypothetical protein
MRTCPLHKTPLVFEPKSKHRLVCTEKVTKDGKTWDCPHVQYTSEMNPDLTPEAQRYIYVPRMER